MYSNSVSLPVTALWGLFGKTIGSMSLKDAYRVMQAKSYLRTSVLRGLHKLEKGSKCPINSYYQAKINVALIKFQKSASELAFHKISELLKEFVLTEGMSREYQIKVLYLQAEVAFMSKNYQ